MNDKLKIRLFSTSTIYGSGYLEYCSEEVKNLFNGVNEVLFIPFARPGGISYDEYTSIAKGKFNELGIELKSLHEFSNPIEAIANSKGIFTGGGNTFLLLRTLYELELIATLRKTIQSGIPYMGTSAGSNIAGLTIGTTNDMPIVYPSSFEALQLVNFNLNPHYLDPDVNSKHKGETRETRIKEFHYFNDQPVVGLREGSWIAVEKGNLSLGGELKARIFLQNKEPYEIEAGSNLNFLSTWDNNG